MQPPRFPKQPVLEFGAWRWLQSAPHSLFDLPHQVATRSGRSALVLALKSLGVGNGDRVLVPTYHCPSMIAPIEKLGAIPVFYPITASGAPNAGYLRSLPAEPVAALIAAHLFGLPRDLGEVVAFCRSRRIALIEDCAHCFYGESNGVPVGTSGDFAIGSLPKFFPVTEGGLLASRSRTMNVDETRTRGLLKEMHGLWDMVDLASQAQRLGPFGVMARFASDFRRNRSKSAPSRHTSSEPTSGDLHAAWLADELLDPGPISRLQQFVARLSNKAHVVSTRSRNYRRLAERLTGSARARPLFATIAPGDAPYVMPLLVENPDGVYERMRESRLPVFRWDRTWPGTPFIAGDAQPEWTRGVIQIACHQSFTLHDIDEIARLATLALHEC